jgi:hypothetical protein
VPIPSFCVESGRWHRRAAEEAGSFSSSKSYLSSKALRMAAKMSKSQGEVWDNVAETQAHLGESLGKSLHAAASPTSYQLSVEDEDLLKRKEMYRAALAKIIEEKPDAVGYAFAINGEINTADAYGSGILFRKLWSKLLDAAALEAIAESPRKSEKPVPPVTADSIRQWFSEADLGQVSDQQEVPPRVRVDTRRSETSVVFDTCDHAFNDAVLHKNLITN